MIRSTRRAATSTVAVAAGALVLGAMLAPAASAAPATHTWFPGSTPAAMPQRATHVAVHRKDRPVTRLIVKMTDGHAATSRIRGAAASLAGVDTTSTVRRMANGATLLALSKGVSTAEAWRVARALTKRGDVAYAEPDTWVYPTDVSPVPLNDPLYPSQWDLWDTAAAGGGSSAKAPLAWARTRGAASVVVAVIDTGITAHPDLVGQTVAGYDFVSLDNWLGAAQPLTANDGNGRDSNPADPGDWISPDDNGGFTHGGIFAGCADPTVPLTGEASSWHGTHVTGTIVGRQNNALGISGMAPGVKVQPVRALGKCGGYSSDIDDAIIWASGGHVAGVPDNATPAQVINMSLGGSGACSPSTQDAIDGAADRNTTVVVAAGNSGESVTPGGPITGSALLSEGSSPADCNGVVVVAAAGRDGTLASYSNFGSVPGSVTLTAQGGAGDKANDVLSTVNAGTTVPLAGGTYDRYAGTSMATPHVAAAAALLASTRVGRTPYTPPQIAAALQALTQPVVGGCSTTMCGAGILDLTSLPLSAPLAPRSFRAQPGDTTVDLSWAASTDDGGGIPSYHVEQSTSGGAYSDIGMTTSLSVHIGSLVNGTSYAYRITATNIGGELSPAQVLDGVVPSTYSVVGPTLTGNPESITATWGAPSPAQPDLTGYALRYRKLGDLTWLTRTLPATTTATTLTTWPTPMAAGTWEVQIAAVTTGDVTQTFGPSAPATVTALAQTATTSATVLRPYVDGYLDSVTVSAASNLTTSGLVRILNSKNVPVKAWSLATGKAWKAVWTGLDSHGRRVPFGTYRAEVLLRGRTGVATAVAAPRAISVLLTQAARPTITLASATLYPYRDAYFDTLPIASSDAIPSAMTWKILSRGKVVYTRSFPRRSAVASTWNGYGTRGRLPYGTYSLFVYAKAGEGIAVASARVIAISPKKVVAAKFSYTVSASRYMKAHTTNVGPGSTAGSVVVQGFNPITVTQVPEFATFAVPLPTSVRRQGAVRVVANSPDQFVEPQSGIAGWYTGPPTAPDFGPTAYLGEPGPYFVGGNSAPLNANIYSGAIHFYVANIGSTSSPWQVDSFIVMGTRYLLH